MEYWTAEGIIRGLNKNDVGPANETLENMTFVVERQARQVLEKNGYGVQEIYLTPGDPEADRREWLNEAFHLLGYELDFELEQAAILLIESSKLQDFLAENKADQAALSASKIIAMTLLPNDSVSQAALGKAKDKHRDAFKNLGKKGGEAKLGHRGSTRLLIEHYYKEFITTRSTAWNESKSAAHLANTVLVSLSRGGDLNREDTGAEDVEYLEDDKSIRYTSIKTGKMKLISIENLTNIIREIRDGINIME